MEQSGFPSGGENYKKLDYRLRRLFLRLCCHLRQPGQETGSRKRVSRVRSGMPYPGMKVPKLTEVRKFLHRSKNYRMASSSRTLSRARKNFTEENPSKRFSVWRLLKIRCRRRAPRGSKASGSPPPIL